MADKPLKIEIDDKKVRALLRGLERRLDNMKPVYSLIGEIVQESIERNFEEEGRPKKWADLSEQRKAAREKKGKWPGQILMVKGRSGGLFGSINYRASDDGVVIGTKKKYATTMHFGARKGAFGEHTANIKSHIRKMVTGDGKKKEVRVKSHTRKINVPWGDIPARPFMMVQPDDWTEIREAIKDFIFLERRRRR
jgi:phage virion morphogenesis protein